MKRIILIFFPIFILASCGKSVRPQEPANTPEIDTVAQNLLYTNQLLVEETNKELALFVKSTGMDFALSNNGFWFRWLSKSENEPLQVDMAADIHYEVWLMDSTKCVDISREVRVGKKEVPPAIDKALLMMSSGEKMEIISPWYCAYGQKGDDYVPAYTNVRFILEVN